MKINLLSSRSAALVKTISIQLPETVFIALGNPHEFVQEMRIVAKEHLTVQ
jgi:hypothetical protein